MNDYIWIFTTYKPKKNNENLLKALRSIPNYEPRVVYDVSNYKSLAAAWNHAIERFVMSGEYATVIICNDDIELIKEDTGKALHFILHGPASEMDGVMTTAYDSNVHGNKGYQFISGLMPSMYQGHYWGIQPGFFCFAVGKSLIDNVGWFDERFKPCFYEDMDMIRRIAIAQKTLYVVAPVAHVGRGSWTSNKTRHKVMEKMVEKSRQRYIKKWGGDMTEETLIEPIL